MYGKRVVWHRNIEVRHPPNAYRVSFAKMGCNLTSFLALDVCSWNLDWRLLWLVYFIDLNRNDPTSGSPGEIWNFHILPFLALKPDLSDVPILFIYCQERLLPEKRRKRQVVRQKASVRDFSFPGSAVKLCGCVDVLQARFQEEKIIMCK